MDSNSNFGVTEKFHFTKSENETKTDSKSEENIEKDSKTRKTITEEDANSNDKKNEPLLLSFFFLQLIYVSIINY